MPVSNGIYVMCANRSSVEQGHIITGTFFPPVATSQEHQLLGNQSAFTNTIPSNYYNSSHIDHQHQQQQQQQYYHQRGDELLAQSEAMKSHHNFQHFSAINENFNQFIYRNHNETINQFNHSVYSSSSQTIDSTTFMLNDDQQHQSEVESDVDSKEFDKYLKYSHMESSSSQQQQHHYHNQQPQPQPQPQPQLHHHHLTNNNDLQQHHQHHVDSNHNYHTRTYLENTSSSPSPFQNMYLIAHQNITTALSPGSSIHNNNNNNNNNENETCHHPKSDLTISSDSINNQNPDINGSNGGENLHLVQNLASVVKTEDDFSEILADVRKTCYSN